MPGIMGIISSTEKESLDSVMNRMILPMHRHKWYRVQKKVVMPVAGIASISLDDERFISERDSTILAVAGQIVEQEQLKLKLLQFGDPDAHNYCLSDLLLGLYLRFGIEALCGLNGLYAIAIWEENTQKLTLINDRYGIGRLYYWISKDRLMFASEYKSISWHPEFNRKVNSLAVSDFLSAGYILDDRTLFEDIKILPAASIATYQDGRLDIHQYWDYEFFTPGSSVLSEPGYLEEFHLRTKEAVKRRIRENTAILLTGGLDSRVIAEMFRQCDEDLPAHSYTVGRENCPDGKYAQEIARTLHFDYTFIPVGPNFLAQYAQECVWRTEGNLNCHASWILAGDDYLYRNGIQHTMTGIPGNAITGRDWPRSFFKNPDDEDKWKHLYFAAGNDFHLPSRIMKPTIYKGIEGGSLLSVHQSFDKAKTDNTLNKFDYINLSQYVRRHAGSVDTLGDFTKVLDPFYDNDLFDFVFNIPPEIKGVGSLFSKLILNYLPKVARIGVADTGTSLRASALIESSSFLSFVARGRRRIQGRLKRNVDFSGDPPSSYVNLNQWFRTGSKNFVLSVLNQKEYLEDFFDVDAVDKAVADHMEGRSHAFRMIGAIVTFSLWRQRFCQN